MLCLRLCALAALIVSAQGQASSRNLTIIQPSSALPQASANATANATVVQSQSVIQTVINGQTSLITTLVNVTATPAASNSTASSTGTLTLCVRPAGASDSHRPTASFAGQTTSQTPAPSPSAQGPDDQHVVGSASSLSSSLLVVLGAFIVQLHH